MDLRLSLTNTTIVTACTYRECGFSTPGFGLMLGPGNGGKKSPN